MSGYNMPLGKQRLLNNVVITDMEAMTLECGTLDETIDYCINKEKSPSYTVLLNKLPRLSTPAYYAYDVADCIIKRQNIKDKHNLGLVLGSTIPSISDVKAVLNEDKRGCSATNIMNSLNCSPAVIVAQILGITNCVIGASAACATSLQALQIGTMLLERGDCEAVLVGGCDETSDIMDFIFNKLKLVTEDSKCYPFNANKVYGTKLARGASASMFLLETAEHAIHRGAKIYGQIIDVNSTMSSRLGHATINSLGTCVNRILYENIWINDTYIDYFNLHGTGTYLGDRNEAEIIYNNNILTDTICAWKHITGHTLAASGLLELGITLKMIDMNKRIGDIRDEYPTILPDKVDIKNNDNNQINVMANNIGLGGIVTSALIRVNKGK